MKPIMIRCHLKRSWTVYASHKRESYNIQGHHILRASEDVSEGWDICWHDMHDIELGSLVTITRVTENKVRSEEVWEVTEAGLRPKQYD